VSADLATGSPLGAIKLSGEWVGDERTVAVGFDGYAVGGLSVVAGFLVFGVTDYAGKTTTCHYGAVAAKEPRDAEVKEACR
jgi:hypothetical protein